MFDKSMVKYWNAGKHLKENEVYKNIYIISCCLILIGLIILFISSIDVKKIIDTYNYKSGYGKIIKYNITKSKSGESVELQYQYIVGNKKYIGTRIGYGVGTPYQFTNAYYNEKTIIVYYDENIPEESILLKGISFDYFIGLFLGLFLIISGSFIFIRHRNNIKLFK